MATEKSDARFDDMLANFSEFEDKMNKLKRVRHWLVKAIDEACRGVNRGAHAQLRVDVPIGYAYSGFEVSICFGYPEHGQETLISLRQNGEIVPEGGITIQGLRQVFENPSPVLDAAARFCKVLGRYEAFTLQMARFDVTKFNL